MLKNRNTTVGENTNSGGEGQQRRCNEIVNEKREL